MYIETFRASRNGKILKFKFIFIRSFMQTPISVSFIKLRLFSHPTITHSSVYDASLTN